MFDMCQENRLREIKKILEHFNIHRYGFPEHALEQTAQEIYDKTARMVAEEIVEFIEQYPFPLWCVKDKSNLLQALKDKYTGG